MLILCGSGHAPMKAVKESDILYDEVGYLT